MRCRWETHFTIVSVGIGMYAQNLRVLWRVDGVELDR